VKLEWKQYLPKIIYSYHPGNQVKDANVNDTNNINTISPTVNATGLKNNVVDENIVYGCVDDPNMPKLEEIVYSDDDQDVGAEADMLIWIQISLSVLFQLSEFTRII
nr:hypothetical protein [Tanacetum cinerariifolium]